MKIKGLKVEEITLIGLKLPFKTRNENNQSMKDCGELWTRFEREDIFVKIPN